MPSPLSTPPPEETVGVSSCVINTHGDSSTISLPTFDFSFCQLGQDSFAQPVITEKLASPHYSDSTSLSSSNETSPLPYFEDTQFPIVIPTTADASALQALTASSQHHTDMMFFELESHGISTTLETSVVAAPIVASVPPTNFSTEEHVPISALSGHLASHSSNHRHHFPGHISSETCFTGTAYHHTSFYITDPSEEGVAPQPTNSNSNAGAISATATTAGINNLPSPDHQLDGYIKYCHSYLPDDLVVGINDSTRTIGFELDGFPAKVNPEDSNKNSDKNLEVIEKVTEPAAREPRFKEEQKEKTSAKKPKNKSTPSNGKVQPSLPIGLCNAVGQSNPTAAEAAKVTSTVTTPSATASTKTQEVKLEPSKPASIVSAPKPKRKRTTRRRLTVHQKIAHNKIEKKYRTNINEKIFGLQDLMPSSYITDFGAKDFDQLSEEDKQILAEEEDEMMINGCAERTVEQSVRPNKSSILERAANYIMYLKSTNYYLRQENHSLLKGEDL